jgi:signal transduction histidine kinase
MKKCLFILAILFCGNLSNFAQKAKIDSVLANLGEIRKNDSIYYFGYSADLIEYYRNVNIDSSNNFLNEFLKISKKQNWRGAEIYLLTQLAYNYNLKGNQFLSIETNYKALALAEKYKKTELISQIKLVLGESYMQLKQFEKARILLMEVLKSSKDNKNQYEITSCLTDLGIIELEQKNYKLAEHYFNEALLKLKNESNLMFSGIVYQNLAVALSKQKKSEKAQLNFEKSLQIFKKEKQSYQIGSVYADLAEMNFYNGEYKKTIDYALQAQKMGEISNSPNIISKANFWLYKANDVFGDKTRALKYYETYITLKDSLNKEDFQKRINSMQFEYENVRNNMKIAEQENNILQKKNENLRLEKNKNLTLMGLTLALLFAGLLLWNRVQLRKINENLEKKVEERTAEITVANLNLLRKNQQISEALLKGQTIERKRVASELHDNLSSLLSAVKMSVQAIKPANLNDSEKKILQSVKEMTNMAYNEVRNISHNILPEDLEEKGLVTTLQKLIDNINISEKLTIILKSNINEKIDPKIEFNLYSIILELINNIIKHAQANEANIIIEKNQGEINITVSDNGIGMEQNDLKGLGLNNIKERAKAINAIFAIDSKKNIGTKIDISVPI